VYGIGAVARMLDIAPALLRTWEERYGVVVPVRSTGDQRLYSRDQVDQLRFVQNLMGSGLHAAEAHRLLALRVEEGMTVVPPTPDSSRPVLILLAERDVYAADVIEYLLRTEGYEVAVALGPADALSLFEERHPDLVFVELVISGGSGIDLCRRLHAAGARIVAVSALAALGEAALKAGAEAFLAKPFDPLHLLATIKDLVGTSRLARRNAVHTPG
jgi:CheY-like chemotaxis protein